MARRIESQPADMATIKRIRRSKHLDKELLPDISKDAILDLICAKLSWRDFHTLATVSHAWRDAIQSRLVYDARVRSSSTETLVVVLYSERELIKPTHTLSLYSTKEKTLNDLPPIPSVWTGFPLYCQCVAVEGKVYILGGLNNFCKFTARSDVYVFDLAGQWQWKQCASMCQPRMKFGCSAKDGKIYVLGGMDRDNPVHGSEVYDPKLNCWSPIKRMISLRTNHQVLAVGEELVVHGGEFLFPHGVNWDDDHPFVDATQSDDEAEGPLIHEAKNLQASVLVEGSNIEPEDMLINPVESSDNETRIALQIIRQGSDFIQWVVGDNESWSRLIIRQAIDYVRWLEGDCSDHDEPMWDDNKAKFFEIYNPVKREWKLHEPSESNCLGRIFTAQGNFYQMTNNEIYVQEIDTDSWKISQSFSSPASGPIFDSMPYATLAVGHELVAIVPWCDMDDREYGFRLLQSTGFGNENKEVTWEITKSLPFSEEALSQSFECPPLMCLIQL